MSQLADDAQCQTEATRIRSVYEEYVPTVAHRWTRANEGNQWIVERRRDEMLRLLRSSQHWPLSGQRLLEIGCGRGEELAFFIDRGVRPCDAAGIDLVPTLVEEARRRLGDVSIRVADAANTGLADESFDLILASTVFSSILDRSVAFRVAREAMRVLRVGGSVLWYDIRYPSPANPHVRALPEREIAKLFPGTRLRLHSATLIPPLARVMPSPLRTAFSAIPSFRSHLLGLISKL